MTSTYSVLLPTTLTHLDFTPNLDLGLKVQIDHTWKRADNRFVRQTSRHRVLGWTRVPHEISAEEYETEIHPVIYNSEGQIITAQQECDALTGSAEWALYGDEPLLEVGPEVEVQP